MLSAIESYSANHPGGWPGALATWKQEVAQRAKAGQIADSEFLEQGHNSLLVEAHSSHPWDRLLQDNFIELVSDILRLWSEVRRIYAALESRTPLEPNLANQVWQTRAFPLWPDFDVALRVSAGILLGYTVLCTLWWVTGWSQGPNALLMGTVALAFFGGADEAGKAIFTFLKFGIMALLMGAGLSYGLLPFAQDFPSFVLVMALVMLPLGAWAASNPLAILNRPGFCGGSYS
ncbi:FUSC family protein [Bordetella petrii]|uniref:Membrane protein n=1 Tax=Bordetella petrii (strain ATCC BAA-461 / DSM 12804 / CCUG 43448 / CIP 107267 / Se-1111R) TaxID=340100 RepID=A9IBI8_BORPD|nr:FUSC family protein [Bordetella petrii]CAP41442.1 putative membrane protein [Bordetella petrii]